MPPTAGSGIWPAWDNQGMPPRPGDLSPGFMAQPGRWWRMVYDHNLQSTHCREEPGFTGRWLSLRRDSQWWRVGLRRPLRGPDCSPGVRAEAGLGVP